MMYHIVPMAGEHLEQVEAIERLCFPDPWSRRLLEELLGHAGAVALAAAGEEGTVLGYTSAQTVLDEGYINNVAVHPAYRRQGIASRLLEELRRRGVDRGLWDSALEEMPEAAEILDRLLRKRGDLSDPKERRRASDALLRRGFSWEQVRAALGRYAEMEEDEP